MSLVFVHFLLSMKLYGNNAHVQKHFMCLNVIKMLLLYSYVIRWFRSILKSFFLIESKYAFFNNVLNLEMRQRFF